MTRQWLARLAEPIDPRPLVPLRLAVGPLVVAHLMPFLSRAADGVIYRDRFWLPYADWYPHLPRLAYGAVLAATAVAGVLVSVGLITRLAAWCCAAGVGYNLFLSQTHFHHNRAFLLILLVGVAVLPTGKSVSLDRKWHTPPSLAYGRGRRLALTTLRAEIALVYLASGISKAIDPDWWGGTVTRLRVVAGSQRLESVPDWIVDLLLDPEFHSGAAKAIVITEVFIGAGLLWRRTRMAAIWTAIPFHLAIEATASVQVFSWAALAALVVWITPRSHDRSVEVTTRGHARIVGALDWSGRFVVSVGGTTAVTDRDGSTRRRGAAARFVAARLPASFWFAAPLVLIMDRGAYPATHREKGPP